MYDERFFLKENRYSVIIIPHTTTLKGDLSMNENTEERDKKIFRVIPIDSIKPNPKQPRKYFDFDDLVSLAQSIRALGVIQPLTVCYAGDGNYCLVAGERRLRACKMVGLKSVPCIVIDVDDEGSAILALVENLQRKDLDFFEQAHGISAIIEELGLSQSEVASRIGKSQSAVANKLRLLRIPPLVRKEVLKYGLSERHARALLKLPPEVMSEAVKVAADKDMSIGEFERYTERLFNTSDGTPDGIRMLMKKSPPPKAKGYIGDMRVCLNTIEKTVKMLRAAGITAHTENTDFDDRVVYTITIKK